jgi:hypothetical protein
MTAIEILRTGKFTDMSGREVELGAADLDGIARAYRPKDAPLVIGHPATDDPAYGWIGALRVEGDRLLAELADVLPEAIELVRKGAFRKVSASLHRPGATANPRPEGWYLRHVGMLGAAAPAVSGLAPLALADDADCLTVELSVLPDPAPADLPHKATVPDGGDDQEPPMPENPDRAAELADRETALAAREAALLAREAALLAREVDLARQQAQIRRADCAAFTESLILQGRALPAEREVLVAALDALAAAPLDLADGAETPVVGLRKLLAARPALVPDGELAPASLAAPEADGPEGVARRAVAYQQQQAAQGVIVSTTAAVAHVSKGAAR